MAIAAASMAIATGLGAWASHGLDSVLDAAALHSFETAVQYQFVHSLGLFGLAIYGQRAALSATLVIASSLLAAGMVLFCGGVYISSLGGPRLLVHLAPVGGIGLIAAWIAVAYAVVTNRPSR